MATGPFFLVCIKDAFVAEDVAGILAEAHPSARVETVRTHDAALALLAETDGQVVAVVMMSPRDVAACPLGLALSQRNARLILLGNEAEETGAAAGFTVLQRPFRSVDLLALLKA